MELILKPTAACNFACTFCSAYGMKINHDPDTVPQSIEELIHKLKPRRIIVTGGEPLMMNPAYFYKLHEISGVGMSLTSNMKDFYLNPDKWKELFNEDWFAIGTSFQYGGKRMWDKDTVYTEDMFLKVEELYDKYTGKGAVPFIATIDDDNYDRAINHVLLAKHLGTTCKLNNVLGIGAQATTFPRYKMFQIFIKLFESDLWQYEANCLERRASKCPCVINRSCYETIRCAYVDIKGKLHLAICDDMISMGNELDPETDKGSKSRYVPDPTDFITEECSYCEMCRLCNRCNSQRKFAKQDPNYCKEMKKLMPKIKEVGWLL